MDGGALDRVGLHVGGEGDAGSGVAAVAVRVLCPVLLSVVGVVMSRVGALAASSRCICGGGMTNVRDSAGMQKTGTGR